MNESPTISPLRVLHVVLDLDFGGLQRVVYLLLQRHDRARFYPYLCALDRGGTFYDRLADIQVEKWILGRRPGPFDWRIFLGLYRIIREHRIDIVHSHNGCGFYAVLAGRLAGVRAIVHTDHGRLVPDRRNAMIEDRLTSYFMDCFVGVSEPLTTYLSSVIKINKAKLQTIVNGVDTERFVAVPFSQRLEARQRLKLRPEDRVVGTVCRLDPIKNLPFLIRRIQALSQAIPECKLVIVGDGPERNHLQKLIAELNIKDRVLMTGGVEKVEEVLPAFDVYACSSFSEGTSMTIIEAMACELPIIATAVGGNCQLIDASTGVLYHLDAAELFDGAVSRLLADEHLRSEMGKAARKKVLAGFSVGGTVRHYEDLYVRVAGSADKT